jgi:DNA-binding NarL/FixJ family response regulator
MKSISNHEYNKAKQPFVPSFTKLDNITEPFEPERCEELLDEGFSDSYIASELKINESFVSSMIRELEKDL